MKKWHRQGTGTAAGGLLMPSLTHHGGGSAGSEGRLLDVTGRAIGWIGRALGWIGRAFGKGSLEHECKNCGVDMLDTLHVYIQDHPSHCCLQDMRSNISKNQSCQQDILLAWFPNSIIAPQLLHPGIGYSHWVHSKPRDKF